MINSDGYWFMDVLHGGDEDDPDAFYRLVEDLAKRSERILRLLNAAPYTGHIALPTEFPFPLESISLN